jgi:hypothetical protein
VYEAEPRDFQTLSQPDTSALAVGEKIVVQNRFLRTWTGGFRVAEVLPDGYRLRRSSDNLVFPDVFAFEEVRRDRRHGIRESHLDRRFESGRWLPATGSFDLLDGDGDVDGDSE